MTDRLNDIGPHYIKQLCEHEGYHELVGMLRPFFIDEERQRILSETETVRDKETLHALACFARDSDECALDLAIHGRVADGKAVVAEDIDALVDLRATRFARETVSRWMHVLLVYGEGNGNVLRLNDLNDAMLPSLCTDTLVLFARSHKMRSGLCEAGIHTEFVDVRMYDGRSRKALVWLRGLFLEGDSVPEPLRRFLADNDPPIRIE